MDANQQQAMRILRAWHTVEFFQPYSVPQKSDGGQIKVTFEEFERLREQTLPWLDPNAYDMLGIPANKNVQFWLYLGLFDKSQIKNICHDCFGAETDLSKALEFEERNDLEGDTCFAKLKLDKWGDPSFTSLSVSTLPWALGHLNKNTLNKLTLISFDQRGELLTQSMDRISATLPAHPNNSESKTFTANGLMSLINDLFGWAEFTPDSQFCFVIDWIEVKSKAKTPVAVRDNTSQVDGPAIKGAPEANNAEHGQNTRIKDERAMPILNSFYIEDIEKVINSIAQGSCNQALLDYLLIRQNKQADLYTDKGLELIIKNLAPELMPPGRWPAQAKDTMSLMQQFAINTVFDELKDEGLLSVNGPPGTGKTTLLRDVIAQNIVNRAKVMASLDKPIDGLTDEGLPIPALTGFEMVVASSNNKAVENISKELPLLSSIGQEFAGLDHYKPIANQLNALKGKHGYLPITPDEQCWGVISAVLGKYKNRSKFSESFFFDSHYERGSYEEANRPAHYDLLRLWSWNALYVSPDFKQSQAEFKRCQAEFNQLVNQYDKQIDELKQLAELKRWMFDKRRESDAGEPVSEVEQAKIDLYQKLCAIHKDKKMPDYDASITDEEMQRHAFWQDESLNLLRSNIFIAALKLHQAWLNGAFKVSAFRQNVFELPSMLKGKDMANAQSLWQTLFLMVPVVSTTFASLGRMFKNVKAGELGWLMIDEAGQAVPQAAVGAIWRSKRVLAVGDPLQVEPVFTTPERLTKHLCEIALGNDAKDWDPQFWSVQQISDRANAFGCQLNVMDQQQWIGIPLWVHRRCIEPMFSIANKIAYDGRMIHGLPDEQIRAQQHQVLGVNSWLVSQGKCTVRQYKHELGQDTLSLLLRLAQNRQRLEDVYIITPFKAVRQQLLKTFESNKPQLCRLARFTQKQFYQWRNGHIGTVHTFQGKENAIVILVLGCDLEQSGGATWASSKPNLLNVAVTRAKQNIFVVGDPAVWQNRRYFCELTKVLTFVH